MVNGAIHSMPIFLPWKLCRWRSWEVGCWTGRQLWRRPDPSCPGWSSAERNILNVLDKRQQRVPLVVSAPFMKQSNGQNWWVWKSFRRKADREEEEKMWRAFGMKIPGRASGSILTLSEPSGFLLMQSKWSRLLWNIKKCYYYCVREELLFETRGRSIKR